MAARMRIMSWALVLACASALAACAARGDDLQAPQAQVPSHAQSHAQARIRGVLRTTTGQPAAGVAIRHELMTTKDGGTPHVPRAIITDADGRSEAEVGAPLLANFWASEGRRRSEIATVLLKPGEEAELALTLDGGYRILGAVTWDSELPPSAKEGAHVWTWPIGGAQGAPGELRADGQLVAKISAPGRYGVWVEAAGAVQAEPVVVELTDEQPDGVVAVAMRAGTEITGRVVLPAGEPVSGVLVRLVPEGSEAPAFYAPWISRSGHTGSAGSFALGPVSQGRPYTLEVTGGCKPRFHRGIAGGSAGIDVVVTR
jgi:hypothetical protein